MCVRSVPAAANSASLSSGFWGLSMSELSYVASALFRLSV